MPTATAPPDTAADILRHLHTLANPANREGMARFGIVTERALGVPMPALHAIARMNRRNHALAGALWASGIHEARILAALVDDPAQVPIDQMDGWVAEFDSWDVCDQACMQLFRRTPHAWDRAHTWVHDEREFVRRAGFVLMATLAVHDKAADADRFRACLPIIRQHACDERNFVRKAVNWALRQIGKRGEPLLGEAIDAAEQLLLEHPRSRSARWIARDALRELPRHRT